MTRKLSYRKDERAMRPINGRPENFGESVSTPMATSPEIFNGHFFPIDPLNMRTQFEVRSFTHS